MSSENNPDKPVMPGPFGDQSGSTPYKTYGRQPSDQGGAPAPVEPQQGSSANGPPAVVNLPKLFGDPGSPSKGKK